MTDIMAPLLLSPGTLADLTGKVRPGAQRRALDRMGIAYFVRPDGRPVVAAAALSYRSDVGTAAAVPNWAAIT